MKVFVCILITLLTILILLYLQCTNNNIESFLSTEEIQNKTGRDYSDCIIKNNQNKINKINIFLKNNPQKIPKIIHQIWIGPKKVPWKWINSFKISFRNKYPGWKYYLWTDEEVSKFNLINKKEYNSEKSYYGKADILRLEILYRFGGIYIDADSEWLGLNLKDLIDKTNYTGFFCANESKKSKQGLANGVVGSSKNNPITKYLIKLLGDNYFKCNKYPPYKTTGPYFIDQVLFEFNITIFPYYYFYPIYWHANNSVKMDIETQKKKFPNSYMTQYGYSTNKLNM